MTQSLNSLLRPSSIAIIGASADPSRIGGRPLRYLREAGFAGAVYPVNPKYREIQGVPAFSSINRITQPVDFALIAVPAKATVQALEQCAAKGVKAAVIFSAGFAEAGDQGVGWQQQLTEIAQRAEMRVLGPNCLGLFNAAHKLFITFTATLDRGFPEPGRLAVVSQSGAYGSHFYILARQRGLKINYWITTGNECDVHVAECVHWLAGDPDTDAIAVYAEGIRDGAMFLRACALARANRKPVIVIKVGRSDIGAEAAASHTASLAGSDAVYDAAFQQYGAYRARNTEELLDIAYACGRGLFPAGKKLGLVTISGGVGVQMADAAVDHGLDVAPMPAAAQRRLKDLLPFAAVRNPVDITAQAFNDISLVQRNVELMLELGGYDAILAFFTGIAGSSYLAPPLREALTAATARFPDRLIALSIIAEQPICEAYEDQGFLVFEDPNRAIAAMAALCFFGSQFARRKSPAPDKPPAAGVALPCALDEHQAKKLLGTAGLPTPPERMVATPEQAAQAAMRLGWPAVVKVVSPEISHKTEIGGVALNLGNAEAVRAASAKILANVRSARPEASVRGLLVTQQIRGGVETILGVQRDPVFGPVVMFGLGGIFVEVLRDVSFRIAPFGLEDAHSMIRETKGYALLTGVRGQPPSDVGALATALVQLAEFAHSHAESLQSIDINPFLVFAEGKGAVALDASILTHAQTLEQK